MKQPHAIRTADHVAALLGIAQQGVSAGEKRALRKLRAAFDGTEFDDWKPTEQRTVRCGRWNGKQIVRVA